ncbi:MAG: hypothetical protein AB8B96_12180 [Lysobacterales bacterium]
MENLLAKAGFWVEQSVALLGLVAVLSACSVAPSNPPLGLGQVQQWLPGDYLGEGSSGPVYHRIVAVDVPSLGGTVFYHHISREGFGLTSFQRKFYRFYESGQVMRSTVLTGAGQAFPINGGLKELLSGLTDEDVLRFPPECQFRWSVSQSGLVAELAAEHCAYASPAFGGTIAPQMTYQLDRCSLSIDEALYRANGEPVFPPSSAKNQRVGPATHLMEDC